MTITLDLKNMSEKNPIEFAEASQKFLCEEYYMHNFGAFLHANGIDVESPEPFESGDVTTTKEYMRRLGPRSVANAVSVVSVTQ